MNASRPNNTANTDPASWSLRNRLIVLLLLATASLWGLASWSVYQEAELESRQLFDDSLKETAYLLLTVVRHEMAEHGPDYAAQMISETEMPESHYLRFQVWDRQGRLIYHSADAPTLPMVETDAIGYTWSVAGDESLRTFVAWDATRQLQIQIAEPLSHRREITQKTLWRLLWFAVLFLPITTLLIWWIVTRSFAPLRWTSESVAERTGSNLSNVQLGNVPREISPLIVAVNRLLTRIRETLEHERRFTADAAHELRTPLAAIRAHAQVLQGARTTEEATEAAQDIIAGVDRSGRLVDQLLALARLDSAQQRAQSDDRVDLSDLVQQLVEEHQAFAARQRITLSAVVNSAVISGHYQHLEILLRNLLDNALRYTPAGGEVQVSCGETESGCYLKVSDSGEGIPLDERQPVFERFYRINRLGDRNTYGSGLGLSIVQQLVEQHGAQISLEDGLQGKGISFVVWFDKSR